MQHNSPELVAAPAPEGKSKITYSTEVITPAKAKEMLATLPATHPPLDDATVERYAAAMKAGGWLQNGMPLIFDENNKLIDGYHRLMAAKNGDVTFTSLVARGVRADLLHTIDQHRRRSFAMVLQARGIDNALEIHRTVNKLIRIDNGLLLKSTAPATWQRLDVVLDANPVILRANKIVSNTSINHLHPRVQLAFTAMALKAGHEESFFKFISELGKADRDRSISDPVRALKATYIAQSFSDEKVVSRPDRQLAHAILAFNDFVSRDEPPLAYSWVPSFGVNVKASDPIPSINQRQNAPRNCGFPAMIGYEGLEGSYIEDNSAIAEAKTFSGATADSLVFGAKSENAVTVRHFHLTPSVAKQWLAKHNTVNRKIQKTHIERISRDIKAGRWMLNAQPISFTGDPFEPFDPDAEPVRLLNGQHRLYACVLADMPIELAIAVNVPEEAFATYDTHVKRVKGVNSSDERVAASAAVLQWRVDHNHPLEGPIRPTASDIKDTMERHPQLMEIAAIIRTAKAPIKAKADNGEEITVSEQHGRLSAIVTGAVMVFFVHQIVRENHVLAGEFLDGLRSGTGLSKGNPILKLREEAVKNRSGEARLGRYAALKFLNDGWEDYKKYVIKQRAADKKAPAQTSFLDPSPEALRQQNERDREIEEQPYDLEEEEGKLSDDEDDEGEDPYGLQE